MDRILQFFDPLPLRGQFLYPERGQKQTFFTPSPPHLVHVVIERPLSGIRFHAIGQLRVVYDQKFLLSQVQH